MKSLDLEEVVTELVGPVNATGQHEVDVKRLANLKELTELTERLLLSIHEAAGARNNHQDSMRKIGEYAQEWLESVGLK